MSVYEGQEPVCFNGTAVLIIKSGRHQVKVPSISIVERPFFGVRTVASCEIVLKSGGEIIGITKRDVSLPVVMGPRYLT
jgi:hypothetical protein